MQFQLQDFYRDIANEELLADLKQADMLLQAQGRTLSFRTYSTVGKYTSGTVARRFGSWNSALVAAGLSVTQEKNVARDALFENLRKVWIEKGKQPVLRDMAAPLSRFSASIYLERFGTWREALREFVAYVQSDAWISKDEGSTQNDPLEPKSVVSNPRRTGRNISGRMRFRILLRDGFSCQACGASPLKDRGVELEVDHVLPWSKGGETVETNLQTKCKQCNQGKGNAFEQ